MIQRALRTLVITPRGVVATLFVFGAVVVCVRLGFWQLDRLQERRARNDQIRARMYAVPEALLSAPRDSSGWLHRRVSVVGVFDNDRSIVLPGRAFEGIPGAHILTPVLLPDGSAVLVDRGWVPAADGASVDLNALSLEANAADSAVVLPFPADGHQSETAQLSAASIGVGTFRRVWFALNERALRGQFPYPLADIHVRLLPAPQATSLPRRRPVASLSDGPHLGYAIQWFCFAIVAVTGWVALLLKPRGS